MNCKNCGAPLRAHGQCEYCTTIPKVRAPELVFQWLTGGLTCRHPSKNIVIGGN